jgi:glycerophosphoryl diester phosphodiesterase
VYTVDDRDEMQRLLDRGVDGIFTNFPDRLRALVGRSRRRDGVPRGEYPERG